MQGGIVDKRVKAEPWQGCIVATSIVLPMLFSLVVRVVGATIVLPHLHDILYKLEMNTRRQKRYL